MLELKIYVFRGKLFFIRPQCLAHLLGYLHISRNGTRSDDFIYFAVFHRDMVSLIQNDEEGGDNGCFPGLNENVA